MGFNSYLTSRGLKLMPESQGFKICAFHSGVVNLCLTLKGSYDQGYFTFVLHSGLLHSRSYKVLALRVLTFRVLTIRGLTCIQGFLQSGVYISEFYMNGVCPDVDIDRCSVRVGVYINGSYMMGLYPDVDIDI